MAVAAGQGSFGIMSLKDVDEIKDDIDSWNPLDPLSLKPIKEVCQARIALVQAKR